MRFLISFFFCLTDDLPFYLVASADDMVSFKDATESVSTVSRLMMI